ncbi:hypothetical protein ACXO1P_05080 [Lactobacillus delbrueckii subsp. bulgaricus]
MPQESEGRIRHILRLIFLFSQETNDTILIKTTIVSIRIVQAKLLEKIEKLSIEEISVVLGWAKEQGLEQLPDNVVSLSINPFFQALDA